MLDAMTAIGKRGSGRTTKQMREAPIGALFVCPEPGYAKALARHLGRDDLRIIPAEQLPFESGRRLSALVLDHATAERLTLEQRMAVVGMLRRVVPLSVSPDALPFQPPRGESVLVWAGACALAQRRHPQARYSQPSDVDDAREVLLAALGHTGSSHG